MLYVHVKAVHEFSTSEEWTFLNFFYLINVINLLNQSAQSKIIVVYAVLELAIYVIILSC